MITSYKQDKDKKKKKKKAKKDEKKVVATVATTAAGKAILLRQQKEAEEDTRVKALQEEEDRKYREEEEREAREKKAIEDEKERKRKAKQDKMDSQKAAGTYMTKAEKEKARKLQERLDSMKAAGMLPGAVSSTGVANAASESGKASSLYSKKKPSSNSQKTVEDKIEADSKEVEAVVVAIEQLAVEEEDDDDEDDWENDSKLTTKLGQVDKKLVEIANDVEDTAIHSKEKENAEYKRLGLLREIREEENRLRK